MDARGRGRIKSAKQAMQRTRAAGLPLGPARAEVVVAGRAGEQSIQKRTQVEASPTRHHGQVVTCGYFTQCVCGAAGKLTCREDLVGFGDIDEMVADPAALGRRCLRSADIEVAID